MPPLSPRPSATALPAPLIPAGPSSPSRAEEQMPPGVEPPARRRPVPASIFPTLPAATASAPLSCPTGAPLRRPRARADSSSVAPGRDRGQGRQRPVMTLKTHHG
ncbi:unnamed protein product [Urochloa humidicola]